MAANSLTNGAVTTPPTTTDDTSPLSHKTALSVLLGDSVAGQVLQLLVPRLRAAVSGTTSGSTARASLDASDGDKIPRIAAIGLAALDAFLQANVTGPVLSTDDLLATEEAYFKAWTAVPDPAQTRPVSLQQIRRACLKILEVDGASPYQYIPHLELFGLAHFIFTAVLAGQPTDLVDVASYGVGGDPKCSIAWATLRIHVWHYKLIAQPSLGGANFSRSSQWSDLPSLTTKINEGMDALRERMYGDVKGADHEDWTKEQKLLFLVEAANNYILLGRSEKATESLKSASQLSHFQYALSGALGKRTKFQEKSISQLVVLARSADQDSMVAKENGDETEPLIAAKPQALQLNDDTLLEDIDFTRERNGPQRNTSELPPVLASLKPDEQPQLTPLDQIILLSEATIKDAFSPLDTLTAEEIMPFATRVLADQSTNWQIYTQALLVRSRIEIHRSRTVERGILQMQTVADQVLTDTTYAIKQQPEEAQEAAADSLIPTIQVMTPDQDPKDSLPKPSIPTSFLPAPKDSESASAELRLRYIHALSTPPRWHLEAELAYAWAGFGSMASALEIFKRLRLWAEVALCLASAAAAEDEDGRGSGGEEKAKGIIRWRLFQRTGTETSSEPATDPDDEISIDDSLYLKSTDFAGPERTPAPPDAARLWCILGDLENEAAHYQKAWEISKHRYARAQRSLGEHYLQQQDLEKAQEAYKLATALNRLSPEMWGRLGDISLRLGRFEDAAEAFSRSIGSATDDVGGEDAKTWSNLGSSLWSLYREVVSAKSTQEPTDGSQAGTGAPDQDKDKDEETTNIPLEDRAIITKDPAKLLAQSLAAYKQGASIAFDNWRIWENVITIAARMRPPAITDLLLALRHVVRIRQTEDAINIDVLGALVQQEVLTKEKDSSATTGGGVYEPPRGSVERIVTRLMEEEIVPLITARPELWALTSRLRAWRRDYAGAVDASERAWRAAYGGSSSGLLAGDATGKDWTTDESAWIDVVKRTDELVSILENYGPDVSEIGSRWRTKARSAVRSVMGRGRQNWEETEGWKTLESLMEGLKVGKD